MRRLVLPLLSRFLPLPRVAPMAPTGRPGFNLLPIYPAPLLSVAADADLEPQVTITSRGEDKVEEYRLNWSSTTPR